MNIKKLLFIPLFIGFAVCSLKAAAATVKPAKAITKTPAAKAAPKKADKETK